MVEETNDEEILENFYEEELQKKKCLGNNIVKKSLYNIFDSKFEIFELVQRHLFINRNRILITNI